MPPGVDFYGQVLLTGNNEVLWSVGDDVATVPASVLKLVTANAALEVLGPHYRFTTRVVEGVSSGELWLVGGGDPTLSRTSPTEATYHLSPPRLSELVDQALSLPDREVTTLGVDISRYDGFPQWNETWRANAAVLGFVTPVTALMVDGGRLSPAGRLSARSTDPAAQAVSAFTGAWGEVTGPWEVEVVFGEAPEGARVVAEVQSQPVSVLIEQMLRDSDNQIAEALIREVAVVAGVGTIDEAARFGLPDNWADSDDFFAEDGSGLSTKNRMSAGAATAVLQNMVASDDGDGVTASLAVPGESGSLQRRVGSLGEAAQFVVGKTGSLVGVRSLAGVINGDDVLIFSVFVSGRGVDDSTRDDIDALVEQFYLCGENLAHFVPTDKGE
jgi:D-alanyl-D-alanine carboxypeptidase/D-alanyl-D-alanine-endopeptidase (penicillin-binding protein 4)